MTDQATVDFERSLRTASHAKKEQLLSGGKLIDPVDLVRTEFRAPLIIKNYVFEKIVEFDNSIFRAKLCFDSCVFQNGLNLSLAQIDNGVKFLNCKFKNDADADIQEPALKLDNSKITGNVEFYRATIEGRFTAIGLQLVGDLNFTACTIQYEKSMDAVVDMSRCNVSGRINFEANNPGKKPEKKSISSSEPVEPELEIRSAYLNLHPQKKKKICIKFHHSVVTDVIFSYAIFIGNVELQGLTAFYVYGSGGEFKQRENRNPPVAPCPDECDPAYYDSLGKIDQVKNFGTTRIIGELVFSKSRIDVVRFEGCCITRMIRFVDGQSSQIDFDDWSKIDSDNNRIFVIPATCGTFFMNSWECTDFLQCNFDAIEGDDNKWGIKGIILKSSRIANDVSFWPGHKISMRLFESTKPLKLPLRDWQVWTSCVVNPKEINFGRTCDICGKSARISERELRKIPIEGSPRAISHVINRWRRHLKVKGSIVVRGSQIGGKLNLTNVIVNGKANRNDRRIDVRDTIVKDKVTFYSPASLLQDKSNPSESLRRLALFELNTDLRCGKHRTCYENKETHIEYRATCLSLDMRGLETSNVDLTGLELALFEKDSNESGEYNKESIDNAGTAQFGYAKVQRKFLTYVWLNPKSLYGLAKAICDDLELGPNQANSDLLPYVCAPDNDLEDLKKLPQELTESDKKFAWPESHVLLPGELDLRYTEIGELHLSNFSFNNFNTNSNSDGILLDFSKFNQVHILRGPVKKPGKDEPANEYRNGFPVPISLLDAHVSSWVFNNRTAKGDDISSQIETAEPYLDLLDNERKFRISSYVAIEKHLRDRGLDDEADKIFIASVYRKGRSDLNSGNEDQTDEQNVAPPKRGKKKAGSNSLLTKLRVWQPGTGREDGQGLRFLTRPWQEYWAYFFSLIYILSLIFVPNAIISLLTENFSGWLFLIFATTTCFLLIYIPSSRYLINALLLTVDFLYWTFLRYGTNARPLAVWILFLAFTSFAFVSGDTRNFTTSTQSALLKTQELRGRETSCHPIKCLTIDAAPSTTGQDIKTLKDIHPEEKDWKLAEQLWVTLSYHIPLVDVMVTDEFEPASTPLYFGKIPAPFGIKARDWFAFMRWANWILWPLFLPYLIRQLSHGK